MLDEPSLVVRQSFKDRFSDVSKVVLVFTACDQVHERSLELGIEVLQNVEEDTVHQFARVLDDQIETVHSDVVHLGQCFFDSLYEAFSIFESLFLLRTIRVLVQLDVFLGLLDEQLHSISIATMKV